VSGHIFVTYSGTDVADPYVQAVVGRLAAAGLSVHAQQEAGTDKLTAATRKLIDTCGAVVPIILAATAGSRRVRGEVTYAQDQGRPVLALWVDGEVPDWLESADVDNVVGRRPPSPDFVERLRQLAVDTAGPPGVPMDLIRRGRHNARRDDPDKPEPDPEAFLPTPSDLPARRPDGPSWGEFTEPAPGVAPSNGAAGADRSHGRDDLPRRRPGRELDGSRHDDLPRRRPGDELDRPRDRDDLPRRRPGAELDHPGDHGGGPGRGPGPHTDADRQRRRPDLDRPGHHDGPHRRPGPDVDRPREPDDGPPPRRSGPGLDDDLRQRLLRGPGRPRDNEDTRRRPAGGPDARPPADPRRPPADPRRPPVEPAWAPDAPRPAARPSATEGTPDGRRRLMLVVLVILALIVLAGASAAIVYEIARG
jgi:hypothetical protein